MTTLLHGHVLVVLASLPEGSFQSCVTSPPFYGLRSYATEPQTWGGDKNCEHDWQTERRYVEGGGNQRSAEAFHAPGEANAARLKATRWKQDDTCAKCGAWKGELGQEKSPDCLAWAMGEPPEACRVGCYLCHMRLVMRALWRVLRADGLCFVELGDGYATRGTRQGNRGGQITADGQAQAHRVHRHLSMTAVDQREKGLLLVPERFRLAMVADGWVVRSVIRWNKLAPMPESVRDRPTSAVSEVVMLAKQGRYFADMEAVRERWADARNGSPGGKRPRERDRGGRTDGYTTPPLDWVAPEGSNGRNPRNYAWPDPEDGAPFADAQALSPEPSKRAHYASFGPKAITPFLKMSTSEAGACGNCGAAWGRVTEREAVALRPNSASNRGTSPSLNGTHGQAAQRGSMAVNAQTTGWAPRCQCGLPQSDNVPCRVIDIFGGSGTTGVVAEKLGLDCTLIDLNEMYTAMAATRLALEGAPLFAGDINGHAPAPTQADLFAGVAT